MHAQMIFTFIFFTMQAIIFVILKLLNKSSEDIKVAFYMQKPHNKQISNQSYANNDMQTIWNHN